MHTIKSNVSIVFFRLEASDRSLFSLLVKTMRINTFRMSANQFFSTLFASILDDQRVVHSFFNFSFFNPSSVRASSAQRLRLGLRPKNLNTSTMTPKRLMPSTVASAASLITKLRLCDAQ